MEKNLGKRYTEDFKKMIVELYIQGKTKKYLSQEYGVSSNTIREWLKREKKEIKEKYKDESGEKLSKKHSKRKLLRILEVSRSSYYYNQKEKKNQREIENEILLEQITLIWQKSHKRYGSKKVHVELKKLKLEVNLKRVKRLMRENRLFSIIVKI